jgi:nitrogen-specific signal transduction histidine kinase
VTGDEDGAVPPRGWEIPREQAQGSDADQLAQLIEQLLVLVPEELRTRLTEAVRQLLEALRALIDWCVARLERRAAAQVEVRDIPIL